MDLKDYPLPLFDEATGPAMAPPEDETAIRFGERMDEFDGYLFVAAEYNHGVPGVLKNALDHVYPECNRKPAAFIGYGGVGGARAVEQLRLVCIELQMAPTRTAVHIGPGAFREVGRVIRTAFLLRFLASQDLRRQITSATNKAESYNNFSKWLLFGGEGVIPDDDPEEQTKKLKYNHLLAASVILQNAADITAILKALAAEGYTIRREDLAQLSPYLTRHIKRFGDYVVDAETAPEPLNGDMPELID